MTDPKRVIVEQYLSHAVEVGTVTTGAMRNMVTTFAEQWSPPTPAFETALQERRATESSLREARATLNAALVQRGIDARSIESKSSPRAALAYRDWITKAETLAQLLVTTRKPFLESAKLEDRRRYASIAEPILASFDATLREASAKEDRARSAATERAFESWVTSIKERGQAAASQANETIQGTIAKEPTVLLPPWTSGWSESALEVPVVHVGRVALTKVAFSAAINAENEARTRHEQRMALTGEHFAVSFPAVLDLDEYGGFSTPHRELVENVTLQLLAALPPGMVRIDAVDPIGLGKSISRLSGLDGSATKIFGDAIWTNSSQTSRLLENLESHVTYVTQKYLQSEHNTLTEYNIAAGEVSEPYRLVLLYDFPSMFTRDGRSQDDEAMHRLSKLVSAGRRAGVFFLVTSSQMIDGLPHLDDDATFSAPEGFGEPLDIATELTLDWAFVPMPTVPDVDAENVVTSTLRGLALGQKRRVDPARVAELATESEERASVRGLAARQGLARPEDPQTWWGGSSAREIEAIFGRLGAREVANLAFNSEMESSALVGGRTGSGKSSLLHSVILDLAMHYSPSEIELYLIDLKEGVEFKEYADRQLPHARVIAIESHREFALAVLRELDGEIARRGQLFRQSGSGIVNLQAYRATSDRPLPRVLVVIDEFHKLLTIDDSVGREALRLLERIIKEGRAFGVHAILGSQSIANVPGAFRAVANQIFYRLVLASSEEDSRVLLGEGNPDAAQLSEAGEGILNARAGQREANRRFQATFWEVDQRTRVLEAMSAKADEWGAERDLVVFDGTSSVTADRTPRQCFGTSDNKVLRVPVGAPMSLTPVIYAEMERAPGRNMLVVGETAFDTVLIACADLRAAGVAVSVIDFGGFSMEREPLREHLRDIGVDVVLARAAPSTVSTFLSEVEAREETNNSQATAQVLVIAGVQRARDLDADDYASDPQGLNSALRRVLQLGPGVGMHTIAWAESPVALERRFSDATVREFGLKLVERTNATSSRRLIGTDEAENLRPDSELILDDYDRATTHVVRRFSLEDSGWLREVVTESPRG